MSTSDAAIFYHVALHPAAHEFEVTVTLSQWGEGMLNFKMPVWTPGSYLVREYARHLQNLQVTGPDGEPVPHRKVRKNHWQVQTPIAGTWTITYRIYADELSVRTNHLDLTHGYFNGAALFVYVVGWEDRPCQVTIAPPETWKVSTALPSGDAPHRFIAGDFHTLVDSPFEIGTHQIYPFTAAGKPHTLAVWGEGNFKAEPAIADITKLIETEAQFFGELPYDHYLFILHLSASGFGGLEHKNSCSLNYPRFGFQDQEKYYRFMQLVAHEFFHLWNVKRLRPQGLETFDYTQENYTPSLWFAEGVTSYYDLFFPYRAGVYDQSILLQNLGKEITRYLQTPGRLVQPLRESSFDAWIKLYRREAHSDNHQISYYLKGEMVALLLDLTIREVRANQQSLDDVLRSLWATFGKPEKGFTEADLQTHLEAAAGQPLDRRLDRWLDTTEELPLGETLTRFGLKLLPVCDESLPDAGLKLAQEQGRTVVKFARLGSPGHDLGITPGDELLALNGYRITAEQWEARLRDFAPGETITLTLFHQEQLRSCDLVLAAPLPLSYTVQVDDQASEPARQLRQGWLGF